MATENGRGSDVTLLSNRRHVVLTLCLVAFLGPITSAVAGTGAAGEAGTFFTGWYNTVVGVLIPLGAAGVAIGFIARAVGNARDGSSPVGAVVGALITAGGAMLLPTIATTTAAGAGLGLDIPPGASYFSPTVVYAFVLIRYAKSRFYNGERLGS